MISIILLISVIVAFSGCTNENTSNKTYSANGVSFTYPGNASVHNSSSIQDKVGSIGSILAVVGDNVTFLFSVAKINLNSDKRLSTLSEWAASNNESIKNNTESYIEEKNITVDGVNGIMMASNDSSYFYRKVFFIKNSTGYLAILYSKSNNEALFNNIISTMKIS